MELIREGNKTYLYTSQWDHSTQKVYKRKKGYFFMQGGLFYFQFSGNSFQMTRSKKYEASLKLIDIPTKSWIAVNADRKGQRKRIRPDEFPFVLEALKFEVMDIIVS